MNIYVKMAEDQIVEINTTVFSIVEKVIIQNCFSQILVLELPEEITEDLLSANKFYFTGIRTISIHTKKKSEHCRDGDMLSIFYYTPLTRQKQRFLTIDLFACNEERLLQSFTGNQTNYIGLNRDLKKINLLFETNIDIDRVFDPITIHLEVVVRN